MHLLDWSLRECFSSFKTSVVQCANIQAKKTNTVSGLVNKLLFTHSGVASKGKIACIPPKRALKMLSQKMRTEDTTLSLISITHRTLLLG